MISGSCEDNKTVFPQRVDTFYERRVFVKLSAAGTADGNINDADLCSAVTASEWLLRRVQYALRRFFQAL